jgi:dihydroorotase
MEIIIKGVTILDPKGPHHGSKKDVSILDGTIAAIEANIDAPETAEVWEESGAHLSLGWMDLQADFAEPGAEPKEGLDNGLAAANAGGFTHVVLNVTQEPIPDTKSNIAYLISRSEEAATRLLPLGTVSKGGAGKQLAEMRDLAESGAVGFSDDAPLDSVEMLRRALEYSHGMAQPVMTCPLELGLNAHPQMHEGATSTHMGVVGNPHVSETMRIKRDLDVLRYTGGKLHFTCISAAESVELIRAAKAEGLQVSCATSAHHLFFVDEDLSAFDGTIKTLPPFREHSDREALCAGVLDGTIDAIISDHRPEDLEHHDVEFMLATYGMVGIETVYPVAKAALAHAEDATAEAAIVRALTAGPRSVLGWDTPHIEVGARADLTWFHPSHAAAQHRVTKGANRPEYSNRAVAYSGKGTALRTLRG